MLTDKYSNDRDRVAPANNLQSKKQFVGAIVNELSKIKIIYPAPNRARSLTTDN
ncbi:hypothetical protein H6G17_22755 [Chroococcidiopsis sp. FACHB-1243]|uniref:hypothetical protein n=1 Tax=Chroococcidiopsis sp. [FACHB-1243] TaxID=2692781 RepID=UPI001782E270|nr:hypothetical protein [Chroococcidiopsis sp. [FACHB-1243]]MBD2308298.1 hypothetical protein [Chroococcidiopsis sp. [FACHB-1243]]